MASLFLETKHDDAQHYTTFELGVPLTVPFMCEASVQAVQLKTEGKFEYVKLISELITTPHGNSHLHSMIGPLYMTGAGENKWKCTTPFYFYVRPNIYNQVNFTFVDENDAVIPVNEAMISIFVK